MLAVLVACAPFARAEWTGEDINVPEADATPGTSSVSPDGVFITTAAGLGIDGSADSFRFTSMPWIGDVIWEGRVAVQESAAPDACVGYMVRADSSAGAPFFAVVVTPAGGVQVRYRGAPGDEAITEVFPGTEGSESEGIAPVSAPVWILIGRIGETCLASWAPDNAGVPGEWSDAIAHDAAIPDPMLVGVCHASGLVEQTTSIVEDDPLTGAIYTTRQLPDGTWEVNENHYPSREAVYLNGGPGLQRQGGNLPDGNYYFQVTDPSGKALLSTDTIAERQLQVVDGVVYGVSGAGNHLVGDDAERNAKPVQLMPFDWTPNQGGEYKVWLTPVGSYDPPNGTFGFKTSDSKTDNFKVMKVDNPSSISGVKFYDLNTDGVRNNDEVTIGGWTINLYRDADGNGVLDTAVDTFLASAPTDENGAYSFGNLAPGTYFLTEGPVPTTVTPGTWVQTAPPGGIISETGGAGVHTVTLVAGDSVARDFGNVRLGAGGGLTKGFWQNKNGQRTLEGDDKGVAALAMLVGLNLRDADGSPFDPADYKDFKGWLKSANAANMAYMLSAQLAGMELNVFCGKVDRDALIYAPGTTSASATGFASVQAIMDEANAELGLPGHGDTTAGTPGAEFRAYQEALKDALDRANNNLTFVLGPPGP